VAAMSDVQINIKSKTFPAIERAGHHTAIADFKLSLKSGEFICLVGPSGCGKTTLLNIIADLDNDYEGEILVGQAHTHPKIGHPSFLGLHFFSITSSIMQKKDTFTCINES
jgi:NitT/TauT family transport system ATP-binding protein